MSNFGTLNAFPLLSQHLTSFILLKQAFVKHLKGVVSEYKDLIEPSHRPANWVQEYDVAIPRRAGNEYLYQEKSVFRREP